MVSFHTDPGLVNPGKNRIGSPLPDFSTLIADPAKTERQITISDNVVNSFFILLDFLTLDAKSMGLLHPLGKIFITIKIVV